jgi:hypothetical protein
MRLVYKTQVRRFRAVLQAGSYSCSLAYALACVTVSGCKEDRMREEAARMAAERAAVTAADRDLQDPLGHSVAQAALSAADGFVKVDKLWRGELAPKERRAFLAVLPYGHCYRFVAAGGPGVTDLDLALIDPNGVELQRDVTQDSTPALGRDASICPVEPGAYRVEARMRGGEGTFAIGLYRDMQ